MLDAGFFLPYIGKRQVCLPSVFMFAETVCFEGTAEKL